MSLEDAFAKLIKKPLSSFPANAEYACFLWADIFGRIWAAQPPDSFAHSLPLRQATGADVAAESGQISIEQTKGVYEHYDLGRSFLVTPWESLEDDEAISDERLQALEDAALRGGLVPGPRYAAVLEGLQPRVQHLSLLARKRSDGSLLDALRCAVRLEPPVAFATLDERAVVDSGWATTLREIDDDELREHLSTYYLDAHSARCYGGERSVRPNVVHALKKLKGYELIEGWDFGEGQASMGVFKIES